MTVPPVRFIDFTVFILRHFGRFNFGVFDFSVFVNFLLSGKGGIAVEGRVGKIARGRTGVIENVEPELAVVIAHARAAPDDLLELGHGIDETHKNDVAAGGRIEAGGEQLRGGEDDGRARLHVLKPLHVTTPNVAFVSGDAADVIGKLLDEVGVQVVKRRAHLGGVFLIHAKHDGFGETVGLLEEICEMPGDSLRAGAKGHASLEIGRGINFVRDFAAVTVEFVLARSPTGGVPLRHDAMHAVGREETVINTLPQAVSVNRVAEIKVGVAVVVAQRRRRHAELIGGRKVFEDVAPVGIFLGAAAMTLVHDDEIEKVRREFFVEARAVGVFGDRLVGGEIKFAAVNDQPTFDFVPGIAKSGKGFILGIVHEEIAVRQI